MDPHARQRVLRLLHGTRDDMLLCRHVESWCHATSRTSEDYLDRIRRCAFNLRQNPTLGREVCIMSDEEASRGTPLELMEKSRLQRQERFHRMLQDKYESLDDVSFASIVKCRKCGSVDVRWDEKQTRSADEGCTLFCTCNQCKNRWVLK